LEKETYKVTEKNHTNFLFFCHTITLIVEWLTQVGGLKLKEY